MDGLNEYIRNNIIIMEVSSKKKVVKRQKAY